MLLFCVWIPILADLSLGIHQTRNCCVTRWFVCAVHQLSSTWSCQCAGHQSQCLGMSLWAALGCAISPLATAQCSLLWDTALGLKSIWGLRGSPSAVASWLPPKSVSGHL